MNAVAKETRTDKEFDELKIRLKTTWMTGDYDLFARFMEKGAPSPVLWGDEATVRDRLREGIADLKCARHAYRFDYPFPPDAVVEFFRINYGPMSRAFASLEVSGQEKLRSELVNLWSAHNKVADGTTKVDAEYLEVIATRG